MKKKIVVLGSQGMAGHIMVEVFKTEEKYEVYGVARQEGNFSDIAIDVTDFDALEDYLAIIEPDYVINCVGALVAQSKENLPSAILLNSFLPNYLSQKGDIFNYKLIHISTDCVFSGKHGNYEESSYRDGDDNYARKKALGEVFNNKDLTIRTSIIGPELKENGTGLLDWFFKQKGMINGYTKAYWSGVTTLELAKATLQLIEQDIHGLYHLCPNEKISKYDLLLLCATIWSKDIEIKPDHNYALDKSFVNTRSDFEYPPPDFKKMLIQIKQWMDEKPDLYMHYQK